MKYSLFN